VGIFVVKKHNRPHIVVSMIVIANGILMRCLLHVKVHYREVSGLVLALHSRDAVSRDLAGFDVIGRLGGPDRFLGALLLRAPARKAFSVSVGCSIVYGSKA
jgi:hypothetical protein